MVGVFEEVQNIDQSKFKQRPARRYFSCPNLRLKMRDAVLLSAGVGDACQGIFEGGRAYVTYTESPFAG